MLARNFRYTGRFNPPFVVCYLRDSIADICMVTTLIDHQRRERVLVFRSMGAWRRWRRLPMGKTLSRTSSTSIMSTDNVVTMSIPAIPRIIYSLSLVRASEQRGSRAATAVCMRWCVPRWHCYCAGLRCNPMMDSSLLRTVLCHSAACLPGPTVGEVHAR